jgi:Putative cyclase
MTAASDRASAVGEVPASDEVPAFDALPFLEDARSGWGVFGAEDTVGRINLMSPERVVAASRLVRTGEVFALNLPLDYFPGVAHRSPPRHTLDRRGPELYAGRQIAYDDVIDNFYPQATSQWDALAHVSATANEFYNGAVDQDIRDGRRCTIDHWARRGIVGRAVLADVARLYEMRGEPYDLREAPQVGIGTVAEALAEAGVTPRPGDVLLIHFGFLEWFDGLSTRARAKVMGARPMAFAGLERSEPTARWLWDSGFAAVAGDVPGVESFPVDFGTPYGALHRVLIGRLGFALGELFDLRALAASSAHDGRYEFFFTSAPLNVVGGVGSTPNALVVK